MKLIVGLGNPGPAYEKTLHNVGFLLVERLASQLRLSGFQEKFQAQVAKSSLEGESFILMKPQTFMNRSGQAVVACMNFYKLNLADVLVISDDLDLAPGKARFRIDGSDGGHRGLRSIMEQTGSAQFKRLRLGVGRPPQGRAVNDYVLGVGSAEFWTQFERLQDVVIPPVLDFIKTSRFENTSLSA